MNLVLLPIAQAAAPVFTTSNLALRYEINNPSSYPGSGTTITDLSGNGKNGTTVNSPTYSSVDGGYLAFASSSSQNAYTASMSSTLVPMSTGYSTFMWVKPKGDGVILDERGTAGWQDSNIEMLSGNLYIGGWNGATDVSIATPYASALNNWVNVGFVCSSGACTAYVNGSSVGTFNRSGGFTTALIYYLGISDPTKLVVGGGGFGNFNFGSLYVYGSALNSTQVLDNYNALKSRYSAPTITSFTPSTGGSGTTVTLTGTNMFGTTDVAFNGIAAASFTVLSDTQTTAVVPNGSATGKITLTSGGNTATSATDYTSYVGPATVSLSLTSGGATTSKNKTTSLTAALNTPGTVTFYANGRIVNRCQAVITATTTATCNWLPLTTSRVAITAYINPSSSSYSAVTSSPLYIQVNKRNTAR